MYINYVNSINDDNSTSSWCPVLTMQPVQNQLSLYCHPQDRSATGNTLEISYINGDPSTS